MTAIQSALPAIQAPIDFDGEIRDLVRESVSHPAVRHPYLSRFAAGTFGDPAAVLRQYAIEYSGYASWFPHYLRAVISRLPCQEHRDLLTRNLEEEQGQLDDDDCEALRAVGIPPQSVMGVPHPVLFRRFCYSLGITDDELTQPTPAAAQWRSRFLQFLNGATAAQAVGALGLGTEHVVKPIYKQLLAGIIGLGTLRRDEFVFFELHCLVDDQHQQDLLEIAKELARAPGGVEELRSGMRTALQLRCEFWDHLYSTAMGASSLANPA